MYETNTFSTVSGLLSSLATFLTANGWTADANLVEGLGRRAHFSKSGLRANFRAYENESRYAGTDPLQPSGTFGGTANYTDYMLCMNLSTNGTYQSGSSWDLQGGCGAVASPTVTAGALTALAVGAVGGAFYLQAPQVVFSGTWTTPPAATATIAGGIVTGFTITAAGTGITGALFVHVVSKDHPGTLEGSNTYPSKPISVEVRGNGAQLTGTYHFFVQTNPDIVWIALEVSAGVFRHLGFGVMNKAGTFTGGEWFAGSQASQSAISSTYLPPFESRITEASVNCFARVVGVDGFTGWLGHIDNSFSRGAACTGKGLAHGMAETSVYLIALFYGKIPLIGANLNVLAFRIGLKYLSRMLLNSQAALLPFYFWCERTKGATLSPMGSIGNAFYINMEKYQKAQLITIGANQFRVFPFSTIGDNAASNYNDGIAVKV